MWLNLRGISILASLAIPYRNAEWNRQICIRFSAVNTLDSGASEGRIKRGRSAIIGCRTLQSNDERV